MKQTKVLTRVTRVNGWKREETDVLTRLTRVNSWEPDVFMSCMNKNICFTHEIYPFLTIYFSARVPIRDLCGPLTSRPGQRSFHTLRYILSIPYHSGIAYLRYEL